MVKAFLALLGWSCLISSGTWASPAKSHDVARLFMNPMDMFMANHGKRSVVDMSEEFNNHEIDEEALDAEVDVEDLLPYFSAPTGFFFLPKVGKRADYDRNAMLSRPNGFLFPTSGKRNENIYLRPNGFLFPSKGKRRNPNGFNFPVMKTGKRSDEIVNFEDIELEEVIKRAAPLDFSSLEEFMGQRGKKVITPFTATRGKRGAPKKVQTRASQEDMLRKMSIGAFPAARG